MYLRYIYFIVFSKNSTKINHLMNELFQLKQIKPNFVLQNYKNILSFTNDKCIYKRIILVIME